MTLKKRERRRLVREWPKPQFLGSFFRDILDFDSLAY